MIPFDKILNKAVDEWAREAFVVVHNDVIENVTGTVLKTQTGGLRRSLEVGKSPLTNVRKNGFSIGTNIIYGVAWEIGSPETPGFIKETTIFPRNARALAWSGTGEHLRRSRKTGRINYKALKKSTRAGMIFARKVVIPKRRIRPFLKPAIDSNLEKIKGMLAAQILKVFGSQPKIEINASG